MKPIIPTIGRVVWFNDGKSEQYVPALICYVHTDDCINIGGFDQNGNHFSKTSVTLTMEDDIPKGQAGWMPYQKMVADKQQDKSSVIVDPTVPEEAEEETRPV